MTVDRGQAASLSVTVDGLSLAAVPGETVAAALVAHGLLAQGVGKDPGVISAGWASATTAWWRSTVGRASGPASPKWPMG